MENRDFRDRLKNHKREVNPAAWDQMEGMLDSLPKAKKEDKRKKRGFWLFFLGIGTILILGITWLLMFPLDSNMLSDQLNNQSTNALKTDSITLNTIEYNTDNDQKEVIASKDNATISENDIEDKTPEMEESTQLTSSSTHSKEIQNNVGLHASENNVTENSKRSSTNENIKRNTFNNSQNSFPLESNRDANVKEQINNSTRSKEDDFIPTERRVNEIPKKTVEILTQEKDANIENRPSSEGSKSTRFSNEELVDEVRSEFFTLDKLLLPFSFIESNEGLEEIQSPPIRIIKPSKLSWFLGGGYALFNANPGYIIQTGTSFELDRILDLEGNLSYSYGSEKNIPAGELFTYERQFDISLIIHFNMIKNRRHKLSFLAGIGYTMYGGQRIIRSEPILIDDRRHNGRNLQLGFNYQLTIDKKSAIGLRFGVISYDDAVTYFAPRYIYSF